MKNEEKEILTKGYWFKIASILSRIGKFDNAKSFKETLLEIIKYIDKIIELEGKEND